MKWKATDIGVLSLKDMATAMDEGVGKKSLVNLLPKADERIEEETDLNEGLRKLMNSHKDTLAVTKRGKLPEHFPENT
ncbi:MAG: hypothetical protein U5L96_07065 [Owenweeksia sp.]|nr:hypothetical protein [Owenweeksia sp.]